MIGAGLYDPECSALHTQLKAAGVILVVIDGDRGSGFSAVLPESHLTLLPDVLEDMAKQMRRDARRLKEPAT